MFFEKSSPWRARFIVGVALGLSLDWTGAACSIDDRAPRASDAGGDSGNPPPTAIVIDTFEQDVDLQANVTPSDSRFQVWQVYAYNTSIESLWLNVVSPGYQSNNALEMIWQVTDPPDGAPNYPGFGVRTLPVGYIDLSTYSKVVFAQQYLHSDNCQPVQNLTVMFGCSQYNASFMGSVPMSPSWTTSTVAFADFIQSAYPSSAYVGMSDCLKVVDGFDIQAQQNLVDGDCASGDLTIDNVAIR
jgi:hypothetical protein